MEHVTIKFSAPAIGRVSRHGMPEVFQVNADLVRAAGLGMALHESFSLAGIQHSVVSQSLAAPIDDGHFLAVDGVPTDGGIDFSVRHAGDSIDEGKVGFFDISGGELIGERAVGLFGFRDHEDSGSFLVESVDDARTLRSAHDFDACAVVKKAVGEGAFSVACAGMDDEAGGFVENEEVFILEKNAQRHCLGGEGRGGGFLGDFQNHGVPFAQNERGFGGIAVHERTTVADETLQAGTGKIGAERTEESVEALAGMGVIDQGFHAVGRRIGHGVEASAFSPSP